MENILVGPNFHIPVPNVNLGRDLYEQLKQRNPTDIAFKNEITGELYSVAKVLDDSLKLGQALNDFGVSANGVIGISANNHINYPLVILAAMYAGIPLALFNPAYTKYELASLFKIVEPEIVFCSECSLDTILEAGSKCATLKKVIVIDGVFASGNKDVIMFQNFLAPCNEKFEIKAIDPRQHLAFILFSSGTTGLPKAVAMTHHSMNSTLVGLDNPALSLPIHANVALGVLPFFHIFGFYQVIAALKQSKSLIILEQFNPFDYLKCIEKYKINTLIGVPQLFHFLAKSPIIDDYNLSSLSDVTCGSAPVSENVMQLVKSRLNLKVVRNAYGSTEAHMVIAVTPPGSTNFKCVGKVAAGTSVCIRDLETGRNLPANEQGEICVKSDMMMKGYYNNEAATKESFTNDGWLRSGDVGYYDEEGYLYVVDRIKEFIKYKGFQVPPAELEAILLTNPKIVDAGVVGKPDQRYGELPVAFVVKEDGVELKEDEVKAFMSRFLSKHKHLHQVYFIEEIPRTRSGKIMRKELRKLLANMTKPKL